MVIRDLDLMYRTIFAELCQRLFDYEEPAVGWFVQVPIKGRRFWYLERSDGGRKVRTFVGPVGDPAIEERVANHKVARDQLRANRRLVTTLVRDAGHLRADKAAGAVISALASAGIFRRDAVLVGAMALQCYPGVLGVKFPKDAIPKAGTTIELVARHTDVAGLLEAVKATGPLVRSSDCLLKILPLADTSLRFLVEDPVRAVLLHNGGVPVMVPSPQRFALFSLMTAGDRTLALTLLRALDVTNQGFELGLAYSDLLENDGSAAFHAAIEELASEDCEFIKTFLQAASEQLR